MANKLSEDGKQIERKALMEAARTSRYCAHIWRAVDKVDYYEDAEKYLNIEKLQVAASGTWGYVAIKEIVYDFKYSDIAMPENYNDRRVLLEQRTLDELSIFQNRQELQPPRKIVEAAYEIVSKQDIEMSLRENDFSNEALGVLLSDHRLIDTLYERWLKWDDSGMEALNYCINRYVQDNIQEPTHFACRIGENYFAISATDEGYTFNFYDSDYGLIDGGVIDKCLANQADTLEKITQEIGRAWAEAGIHADLLCDYNSLLVVSYENLRDKVEVMNEVAEYQRYRANFMQEISAPDVRLTANSEGISVEGFIGTWYVIDVVERDGKSYYLLEHEEHGDDADPIFVDKEGTLVVDCARNGAEDLDYFLESENDDDDLEPDC